MGAPGEKSSHRSGAIGGLADSETQGKNVKSEGPVGRERQAVNVRVVKRLLKERRDSGFLNERNVIRDRRSGDARGSKGEQKPNELVGGKATSCLKRAL